MKLIGQILTFIVFAVSVQSAFAQDGEGLFKAKCAVCHIIGKDATGPNLVNIKAKWDEAGEGDLIYEWIKNPQTLVATGKSTMANAAKDFSPSEMTPQEVTNEEIDAILSYVDNYVPPAKDVVETVPGAEPAVVYVPNYDKNLNLFYILIIALFIQLLAIIMFSTSIKSFVKLEQMKKSKGTSTLKSVVTTVIAFGVLSASNVSHALSFVGPSDNPDMPWLLVEDSDIYVLVTLNIAMVFLVLHFRKLFLEIASMIRPRPPKALSARRQRRMNKILTDAVPIEEEHTILMHHEYDGIRELDNNLPPWWVWGFYATIVFSIIYIFNYHIFKTSDLQIEEYNKSIAAAEIEVQAYLEKMAMNVDESNVTLLTDESALSTGKVIFDANCVTCHNPKGEGNQIGPNLTDKNWIYGFDIKDVFSSVKNGRPNGMPEHNSKLNPIQLQQVASYVLSFKETEGREAQGDIVEP